MTRSTLRAIVCAWTVLGAAALVRPADAGERARLAAALDDRALASSPAGLRALGEEANAFSEPDVRIAAWLFAAEGLAERVGQPVAGAVYAGRALAEPAIVPVDRGRAVAVLAAARTAAGDYAGAIVLAEREAVVTPGLAKRLRAEHRAHDVLTVSRCALGALGLGGFLALVAEGRGGRAAFLAVARQIFDAPVWLAAASVGVVAVALARAFDPAVDPAPFYRLALGIVLVHATLAAARRFLRPMIAATLGVGSFAFVAAWAYLASARPLPEWAAP